MAVGFEGAVLSSPDGITWSEADSGTESSLSGVAYGNGTFVAVGLGTIIVSTNGISWNKVLDTQPPTFTRLAYGEGKYVATGIAVGDRGAALSSNDLDQWSVHEAGTNALWSVAFGNGTFVAVGSEDVVWLSTNGLSWTPSTTGHSYLGNVEFGNGVFVAMGGQHRFFRSTNGSDWQAVTVPYLYHEGGAFAEGLFVTVGYNGAIMSSPDGLHWLGRESDTQAHLFGVCFGNGSFLVVGQWIVLESGWTSATTVRLAPTMNEAGLFSISFSGAFENEWELQASGDLSEWSSLGRLSSTNLDSGFIDEESGDLVHRFYRAIHK